MSPVSSFAHGLDPERLKRVDQHLRSVYLDTGKLPFASLLIARNGEIAHGFCEGAADEARGKKAAPDTIVRIYSMTKPVTSVVLMMLVEEGKVALDDPVEKFIPAFGATGVFAGGSLGGFRTTRPARAMQVIDLLRHTSGLTYGFQERTNVDAAYRKLKLGDTNGAGSLKNFVEGLAAVPLEFSPGTAWNYSVSTDVLGHIIEVVEGRPLDEVFKTRLFEPLGMVDTGFSTPASEKDRFAACYRHDAAGRRVLQDDPQSSPFLHRPELFSGGGGLVSTAGDYMKFASMLLAGGKSGGRRYLGPKILALMTQNHLPGGKDLAELSVSMFSEATYAGVGFGLGFAVTERIAGTLLPGTAGEYAWGGLASTFFFIDPAEKLAVVFLTQLMPSSLYPIRRELRTLIYAALDEAYA